MINFQFREICITVIWKDETIMAMNSKEKTVALTLTEVEAQLMDSVKAYIRTVVSTGGGAPMTAANWGAFQSGIVVFLDVSAEELAKRLDKSEEEVARSREHTLSTSGTEKTGSSSFYNYNNRSATCYCPVTHHRYCSITSSTAVQPAYF